MEIGIIASGSKYTAPIMVFLFVIIYIVQLFYLRTSRQLRLLELESSTGLFTHFDETSRGAQHIRSFGWKEQFHAKLSTVLNRSQKPLYLRACSRRWLEIVLDFTATAAAIILVAVASNFPGSTSNSALGLAMLHLISFSESVSGLVISQTAVETGLGAVSRLRGFCQDTPQEQDAPQGPELPLNWPDSGRIDLDSIVGSYQ